ncbi:transcription/translation regulatory transformer protein RfaH [Thalassolituus hydrocarboniclasticus]|uniref:Transcription/translation regulatory transformer protein RfaH n=1 Tax=Thalassolituus hydrocarboniclasticus TaxID=2742796 RepID=A0ABY6AB50_9GAMM|nr:transcription/translation regulatory transformer protein RfaH [Thalassolituus hydrocarboniclasticus]UXD87962.1 transcription/translation regulatory transformer protein RfaH [Thalassolituus hydrocarboniclasticus]
MQWYVVLTKPRQEQRALEHLVQQGASAFLPLFRREHVANGKRAVRDEPLFPGYLFLQSNANNPLLSKIRSTLGARGLLYFGTQPAVVSSLLVDDLQQRNLCNENESLYKKGQKVTLNSGPFKNYEAIFQHYDGEERAMILLSLLGQQSELLVELQELAQA